MVLFMACRLIRLIRLHMSKLICFLLPKKQATVVPVRVFMAAIMTAAPACCADAADAGQKKTKIIWYL